LVKVGNAVYIGRTSNIHARLSNHLCKRFWLRHNMPLYLRLLEVQPESVVVTVRNFDTLAQASEAERVAFDFFGQMPGVEVLNQRRGGTPSPDELEKFAAVGRSRKGQPAATPIAVWAIKRFGSQEFPSLQEAARQLNLSATNISKCLRGELRKTGGFTFLKLVTYA